MAIEHCKVVWDARGLKPLDKLVLVRIADRVNRGTDVAWPGVRSLAADCGLSHQGVLNVLNRLIARGYLDVVEPSIGTRSRRYSICFAALLASGQPGRPLAAKSSGPPGRPQREGASGQPGRPQETDACGQRHEGLAVNAVEASGQRREGLAVNGVDRNRNRTRSTTENEPRARERVLAKCELTEAQLSLPDQELFRRIAIGAGSDYRKADEWFTLLTGREAVRRRRKFA